MIEELKTKKELCFDSKIFTSIDEQFPFHSSLSLSKLIKFWEQRAESENPYRKNIAADLLNKIANIPQLQGNISEETFYKHFDIIEILLTPLFPSGISDHYIATVNKPFAFSSIYSTSLFKKTFGADLIISTEQEKVNFNLLGSVKIINALRLILQRCYGIETDDPPPIVVGIRGNDGLDKYYQLNFIDTFINVEYSGALTPLDKDILQILLSNKSDFEKWREYFPPEKFAFNGFSYFTAVEVTENEILSLLKYDLLEKESIISLDKFYELRNKLRSYFNLPNLRLGLAAFNDDWQTNFDYAQKIGNSFILNDNCTVNCQTFKDSIYDLAVSTGEIQIIEDMAKIENPSQIEIEIVKLGIRNLLVAPLYYKEKLIGILELGSANPGELNHLNKIKVLSILSLFATSVKRSLDEFESSIQSIIKQECTAIHPTVEWRFRKAAINKLINRENLNTQLEPIIFNKLFPLYALSDIRNSSNFRIEAIKDDLLEHLLLIDSLLSKIYKKNKLPYLMELNFQINKLKQKIEDGLSSGDEVEIIEFINREIEPVFLHFGRSTNELKKDVDYYFGKMDKKLNIYYKRRLDFESSVSTVNETIANYIDSCEIQALLVFPFFSEKYKTDGVEYSIYIGESLVENKKYDDIYLKNLRLWQIVLMCGVVKKAFDIKPKLKIPLDTAQLILVQNSPLSIRFRYDEKKFDVDGTYNIRYEIMKKRIDKAVVNGTKERLTQPGKIAIVYSQNKEALEYIRYIEFLQAKKIIKHGVEHLDLEELQGVKGLKALRVEVSLDTFNADELTFTKFQFINT